jgi:predicted Zn-dependent protease
MVGPDVRDQPAALAEYSLGVMLGSAGRADDAIVHLRNAVKHDPTYVEAMVALGDVLRHKGDDAAALQPYADAVRVDPRRTDARLAYTFALVRLHRWADVRNWLTESVRAQPERPELANALARVYAAAPDNRVRDGRKAFEITQTLLNAQPRTTALGETMAMVTAELGNFMEAVNIQRDIIDAATRAGHEADVRRMRANLQLYEHGRPCRTPWTDEEMTESQTNETR